MWKIAKSQLKGNILAFFALHLPHHRFLDDRGNGPPACQPARTSPSHPPGPLRPFVHRCAEGTLTSISDAVRRVLIAPGGGAGIRTRVRGPAEAPPSFWDASAAPRVGRFRRAPRPRVLRRIASTRTRARMRAHDPSDEHARADDGFDGIVRSFKYFEMAAICLSA